MGEEREVFGFLTAERDAEVDRRFARHREHLLQMLDIFLFLFVRLGWGHDAALLLRSRAPIT
ncbi:MAG: hypothetical protein IIC53_03410 [Proteobacteria bacterium]|nr:hypothetical protein [Pseudomonadota bacterium]